MSAITIQQMADRVAALLEDRLQVPGADLTAKLRRVRHQLPRQVREAMVRLARAATDARSPKLLLQIDEGAVATDFDICVRHLTAIAPGTGFLRGIARVAVSVGLGLLVLGLAFLAFRGWRGGL
jgi:hypothetical protein